ncbi:unnamed protein product [Parnassius apollo]|uniref:(apollo) hypothetical protein n=1 Tax=Parnassius apollo TaxID=110799 RepID=A0A8S3Y3U3_PARAO|nr:unnamed protein product [Parnassius apollo]
MASTSNSRKRNLTGKLLEQALEQWVEEDNEHEFSDVDDEVTDQNVTIEEKEHVESEISKVEEVEIETSSEGTNRSTNTPDSNRNCYRDSKDMQVLSEPFSTYDEGYTNNVQTERTPVATPLSKTISFMDSLSSPIPDIDKNKIKKKIFELNVLSNSLES